MEVYRRKHVVFAFYVYECIVKHRKRKYWTHPLVSARLLKGSFITMFTDLRNDERKFFNYFRMSIKSLDELSGKLTDFIKSKDTVIRLSVTPMEMIAVTLRYLESGCALIDLHYQYRLGLSTVCKIVRKVCKAIWSVLREECIPQFSRERWIQNAEHFEKNSNFPNCLGALDGKHVRIIKPNFSGSQFFNYKKFHSIVLFVVADSNYLFNYIEVGSRGREGDSSIFEYSKLYEMLENGEADLPTGKPLPGTERPSVSYTFIGDEAFSLSDFVMRPYTGTFLSYKKRIFNYRLCRARRYVECAFGILTAKWRIFQRALNVDLNLAIDIVKCCCILHNYVRVRDGYNFDETLTVHGLEDMNVVGTTVQGGVSLNQRRNTFADYFVSDAGKVSWQDAMI